VDERKSWNRLIFAYSGVGLVVLGIGFFLARGASHNDFIVAHAGSTATPSTVVGIYSGIAPDATATPEPSAVPTPSPDASASASPTPHASPHATPHANPSEIAAAALVRKLPAKARPSKVVADAGTTTDGAAAALDESSRIIPTVRTAEPVAPVQTAAPAATPTPAPVQVAAAPAPVQAAAGEPVFAPERIVDAQVRVAVQPDESQADVDRGAHGTSVVLVTIDPKGNVINAVVGSSSGYSTLDRAAISAARASQFIAPKINGRPATETYRVVYDFGQ